MIIDKNIDKGTAFDWGKASKDYALFRDIYPSEFYQKILDLGICTKGQKVLDLGTGTGVLPRNLYKYGASFVGADISKQQIEEARRLSIEAGMNIEYMISPAEDIKFPDSTFDVVTACQCFFYFDTSKVLPNLKTMLTDGGHLAIMFLAWLPNESEIAHNSEKLVLKYSPNWTGAHLERKPFDIPEWLKEYSFTIEQNIAFDVNISFTRHTWNGRMKACRGVGASLSPEKVAEFETEHLSMLDETAPEVFDIPHYATMLLLKNKKC